MVYISQSTGHRWTVFFSETLEKFQGHCILEQPYKMEKAQIKCCNWRVVSAFNKILHTLFPIEIHTTGAELILFFHSWHLHNLHLLVYLNIWAAETYSAQTSAKCFILSSFVVLFNKLWHKLLEYNLILLRTFLDINGNWYETCLIVTYVNNQLISASISQYL